VLSKNEYCINLYLNFMRGLLLPAGKTALGAAFTVEDFEMKYLSGVLASGLAVAALCVLSQPAAAANQGGCSKANGIWSGSCGEDKQGSAAISRGAAPTARSAPSAPSSPSSPSEDKCGPGEGKHHGHGKDGDERGHGKGGHGKGGKGDDHGDKGGHGKGGKGGDRGDKGGDRGDKGGDHGDKGGDHGDKGGDRGDKGGDRGDKGGNSPA
jgi:hypothetical protein